MPEQDYFFISHATKDDEFVKELRKALEILGVSVWVDSRNLRGGAALHEEISSAIEKAAGTIVVLGPASVNSAWMREEIRKAQDIEHGRNDGYRTIPILLPGIETDALPLWFEKELLAIPISLSPGELQEKLPQIMIALGYQFPADTDAVVIVEKPVAGLILKLSEPVIKTAAGETRACAVGQLVFMPVKEGERMVENRKFSFRSPVGQIEYQEISWYLEEYFRWPVGVFRKKAEKIEEKLAEIGRALYDAVFRQPVPADTDATTDAVAAWKRHAADCALHFSVMVDREHSPDASKKKKNMAEKAATELLSLPWELLHDNTGFLMQGAEPVFIKRQLPNRIAMQPAVSKLPVRILFVSPRPEDEKAGYIDHRISALPFIDAVEHLGGLVSVTMLSPATFPAMEKELKQAFAAGPEHQYDVVHFDGHGVFDEDKGLGALCFEDPDSAEKLSGRKSALVYAEELGACLNKYRIPLVFLEACQSAKSDKKPTASVAARLLEAGTTSVIAMTHSVLIETARRFVQAFYTAIARGSRTGAAVLDARQRLAADTNRGKTFGPGTLRLHDWFVPVLYQEEADPRLITRLPGEQAGYWIRTGRKRSLGRLADEAAKRAHDFVGRSRELLALERLLVQQNHAVIRGQGGAGKTTIAIEAASWLVRSGRFEKAAFLCVEHLVEIRSLLDELGAQLLPSYSAGTFTNIDKALQPIARVLQEYSVIIVIDNMESILPSADEAAAAAETGGTVDMEEVSGLCTALLSFSGKTRIIFTTREQLPAPFAGNEILLGALSKTDAVKLVSDILKNRGTELPETDSGDTPEEIDALVTAVNCHARALVLLSNELAQRGIRTTTTDILTIVSEMEQNLKPGATRETSLFASLELSLRRLPETAREQLKALSLFNGGMHLSVLAQVLQIDPEQATLLGLQLIAVGLAEAGNYGHISLDPALPAYMRTRVDQTEFGQMQKQWAEAMIELVRFLYNQQFEDAQMAAELAIRELPNLLCLLDYMEKQFPPEEVVDTAGSIEQLIAPLHRPKALQQIVRVRKKAGAGITGWNHAAFNARYMAIERMLSQGDLRGALQAVQELLQQCMDAGEQAYPGADYDIAIAFFMMGRIVSLTGNVEQALPLLAQAEERFSKKAETGRKDAERMVSLCLTEKADCLVAAGRLEEAVAAYEEGMRIVEKRDDKRDIAVIKTQLGTVRMYQKHYKEAIAIYTEATEIAGQIREPQMEASALHQIGRVHEKTGNFRDAERAYKESLAISIRINDKAGEAASLNQLGSLYLRNGQLEDAVTFLRQACDIAVVLKDLMDEGRRRNNLALAFIMLKRFDEAREEVVRAIECKSHFGHATELWSAFNILFDLETAMGNPEAAAAAWQKAFDSYLQYRRDGGYSRSLFAEVAAMFRQGLRTGDIAELKTQLEETTKIDMDEQDRLFFTKLAAVVEGEWDMSLAQDTGLFVLDAVELFLLLEELQ